MDFCKRVHETLEQFDSLLIYCRQGKNRSAAGVLLYYAWMTCLGDTKVTQDHVERVDHKTKPFSIVEISLQGWVFEEYVALSHVGLRLVTHSELSICI
jgi:hypothetical protein